jgi:ABC-type Mn2+/Zn2+ transport system permease subunit
MDIALTSGLLTAASLLQDVAQPLSDGFMQRALLEVALVGIAAGGLGCWIVFYGLSYASESLTHSMFPGLVIAALLGVPLLAGGAVGIVVAALAIALAARAPGMEREVAVAVVVTTLFGTGALLALSPASPPGIQTLLFGDILATSDSNLLLAAVLAAAIVVSLRFLHGRLLAVGFNRSAARSLGASPVLADAALLVLIAAAILVAVQGLGNLLVVAVLVGPAATARLLTRRMAPMMICAAAIAIATGVAGLYVSYYAGTAAGASIAASIVLAYLVAVIFSRGSLPAETG